MLWTPEIWLCLLFQWCIPQLQRLFILRTLFSLANAHAFLKTLWEHSLVLSFHTEIEWLGRAYLSGWWRPLQDDLSHTSEWEVGYSPYPPCSLSPASSFNDLEQKGGHRIVSHCGFALFFLSLFSHKPQNQMERAFSALYLLTFFCIMCSSI